MSLFTEARQLFGKLMWPAIWLYCANEVASVLMHRISHRIVNQCAQRALRAPRCASQCLHAHLGAASAISR